MEKKKKFIIDICCAGLILLIVSLMCKYIVPILVPFIIAFSIASVLHIPVRKLCQRFKKVKARKRTVSMLAIILFYILIGFGVAVAGLKIVNTFAEFIVAAPSIYQNDIMPALDFVFYEVKEAIESLDPLIAERVDVAFTEFLNNIGNYITNLSMKAISFVSGSIVWIPEFIIKLIITIISSVFFMLDYDMVIRFFKSCIPSGKKEFVMNFLVYVKRTILIYLKSYSILFLLTYVELSIGFRLIGIPYAPVVALAVAVFDILPVLGTGGILLPWTVILFVMRNIQMAVGMLVLYLVITVIRNTVEPKIVGKQIGLHPLATLIAMYVGLNLIGLLGMIIFPVTLVVLTNMKRNAAEELQ